MILSDFQNNILQQIIQAFMYSKTAGRFPELPISMKRMLTMDQEAAIIGHRKGAAKTRSALKVDESDRRTCQGAGGHFFLP